MRKKNSRKEENEETKARQKADNKLFSKEEKERKKESREELSKVGGSNIKRKGGKQQPEKQRKSKWKNKIQTLQIDRRVIAAGKGREAERIKIPG